MCRPSGEYSGPGPNETDVAEDRAHDHLLVVGAHEEPHVDLVSEGEIRDLARLEEIAEPGGGNSHGGAFALDLEYVRPGHLRDDLLRLRPGRPAELERREAVPVHHGVGVG